VRSVQDAVSDFNLAGVDLGTVSPSLVSALY
jgi:hypothetical protein